MSQSSSSAPPRKAARATSGPADIGASGPRRPRRKLGIAALVTVLVLGVVGTVVYHRLTAPERILAMVKTQLQVLPCPSSVASARFSFLGGLDIEDLSIGPCGQPPEPPEDASAPEKPLPPSTVTFRCDRLHVFHQPLHLLLGRFRADLVVADNPVLDLAGDTKYATRPFKEFEDRLRADAGAEGRLMPAVELNDGAFRVFDPDDATTPLEQLPLTIRARPTAPASGVYDIVWQDEKGQAGRLHYDLRAGRLRNVAGGTPWLSVQSALTAFSPRTRKTNQWCRMTGLRGQIRARDFDFPVKGMEVSPSSLDVEMRSAALAIPARPEEKALAPRERFLEFSDIQATAAVTADHLRVDATGDLHGNPVRFALTVPGGARALHDERHPEFRYEVDAARFELPPRADIDPRRQRALQAVPTVEALLRELDLTGPVGVELAVSYPSGSPDGMLERLTVHGEGARARPEVFPYPIDAIVGELEVLPDSIAVRSVCGRHADATICVSGDFTGRTGCAAAELTITAESVPIDSELYAALGRHGTQIKEQFQPQGRLDARVTTVRPTCSEGDTQPRPWRTETTVRLADVRARYHDFAYAFDGLTGPLVVRDGAVLIDLAGRAGQSPISVSGRISRPPDDDQAVDNVQVQVSAVGLPIDERLYKALSEPAQAQVRALGLAGPVNLKLDIESAPPGQSTRYTADVELVGASIRHTRFPLPIEDLRGRLSIHSDRIELSGITGRYKEATITAEGVIGMPGEPQTPSGLTLAIDALDLRLDDDLVAAAPPGVAEAMRTWRVEGAISGDLELTGHKAPSGEWGLQYQGDVRFFGPDVRFASLPAPFSDVQGILHFDQSGIRAEDLAFRYGKAAARADVFVQWQEGVERGRIALAAAGVRLDEELLTVLPDSTSRFVRRLQSSGYLDARLDRLEFTRPGPDRPLEWDVDGSLRLYDVDLPALHLTAVSGDITLSGFVSEAEHGAILKGDVRLDRATVLGRELTRLDTPWSLIRSSAGEGELGLERIHAGLYAGEVSGRGNLRFDSRSSEYSLTAVAQNVQMGPFLNAGRTSSAPPVEATGLLAANLYLAGDFNRTDSLRGGGRFEVIKGDLYKLPIILAILNVLELSAPTGTLDEASADFKFVGRKVSLDDIVLRGGILAMVGRGSATLPDLAVDLRLVNVPDQWWSRLPVIAELMEGAARELVQVRVTGPISQPTVRTDPVPRITEEIRSLFQKRGERKPPPTGSR